MIQDTTNGFAARWNVEYAIANGLIQFLKAKGIATFVKVIPPANGKGKGSNVYAIPENVTLDIKGKD